MEPNLVLKIGAGYMAFDAFLPDFLYLLITRHMGGDLEDILMLFTVVLLLPEGPPAGNMQLPGSSKKNFKK